MTESRYVYDFLHRCKTEVNACVELLKRDGQSVDLAVARLEHVKKNIIRAKGSLIDSACAEQLIEAIQSILLLPNATQCELHTEVSVGYCTPRSSGGSVGAPKCVITKEQLVFLVDCGFNCRQMAEMMNVSQRTVMRRLSEQNIRLGSFSEVTDPELKDLIQQLTHGNYLMGPNSVRARLLSKGVKVQRSRVRKVMLEAEPAGAALRGLLKKTHRRIYSVAGPNSLWHIDGNHKLIRWNMVIHCGIDGYSRLIVFVKVATNNAAATVLAHFIEAGVCYGFPSRVRTDHGGENNDVCQLMEILRGDDRGSAIRGSSVHNQRVERAWLDIWKDVTNIYYELFYFLEDENLLNADEQVDLWCLHFVYIPRIAQDLVNFQRQWNCHGIRTENHLTPVQLFVSKALSLSNSSHTAMVDIFQGGISEPNINSATGTDLQSTARSESTNPPEVANLQWQNKVEVPAIPCPLNDISLEQLKTHVDPLDTNMDMHGIGLYLKTKAFVLDHIIEKK